MDGFVNWMATIVLAIIVPFGGAIASLRASGHLRSKSDNPKNYV